MSGSLSPTALALLDDPHYHIEFGGYLTNHAKHGVIAMARLDAPDSALEAFFSDYTSAGRHGARLEPARVPGRTFDANTWNAHLGERLDYAAHRAFFEARVDELGLDEAVRRFVPQLLPGCAGALFHGMIHLGWALDAGSRTMTVEGLAYMAHTFLPRSAAGEGEVVDDQDPWTSLLRIASSWHAEGLDQLDAKLARDPAFDPTAGFHPEIAGAGAQMALARVLAAGDRHLFEVPTWATHGDPSSVWAPLHRALAQLFVAHPGNFFLLHVITGTHALEQIMASLDPSDHEAALRVAWQAIVGLMLVRVKLQSPEALRRMAETSDASNEIEAPDWSSLIQRSFDDPEEHNRKLVYVMRSWWERHDHAPVFFAAAQLFTA